MNKSLILREKSKDLPDIPCYAVSSRFPSRTFGNAKKWTNPRGAIVLVGYMMMTHKILCFVCKAAKEGKVRLTRLGLSMFIVYIAAFDSMHDFGTFEWENFRGFYGFSRKFSPWITCCVQYMMATAWSTTKVFQWTVYFVHNRESFPTQKFCRIQHV